MAPMRIHASPAKVIGNSLFVFDDVPAEVKDWQGEKVLLDQEQAIEHSPSAAISISKRMDRLELIMGDSHSNKRVKILFLV